MTRRRIFLRTAILSAAVAGAMSVEVSLAEKQDVPIEPLAAYDKLDPKSVTVSGISSGAFFAHQFHVAYSSLVKGAGLVAGGPYGCAEQVDSISPPFGNPFFLTFISRRIVASLAVCTHLGRSDFEGSGWRLPAKPDANEARHLADRSHADGTIEDPANLARSRIWLFHGDQDNVIPQSTGREVKKFYELMGVPAANIEVKDGPGAKHGMPIKTLPAGSSKHCELPDPSFLVRCDYGAAELLLRHLYSDALPARSLASGRIVGFDQTKFFNSTDESTSLNGTGYLYVPEACENSSAASTKCRLHVAFHGCEQYVDKIHDLFIRDAGYNDWADAHHVIVLYPQAKPWLWRTDPSQINANPKGCWDWWGYSGGEYLGRNGKQMRAVRQMIGRMLPN